MTKLQSLFMGVTQVVGYGAGLPNRDKNGRPKHISVGNIDRGMISHACRRYHMRIEMKKVFKTDYSSRTRFYADLLIPRLMASGPGAFTQNEANSVMHTVRPFIAVNTRETQEGRSNATVTHWLPTIDSLVVHLRKIKEVGGDTWDRLRQPPEMIVIDNILQEQGYSDQSEIEESEKNHDELAVRKEVLKRLPKVMAKKNIKADQGDELCKLIEDLISDVTNNVIEEEEKEEEGEKKKPKKAVASKKDKTETSGVKKFRDIIMSLVFPDLNKNGTISGEAIPPFDVALFGNMAVQNLYPQVTPSMTTCPSISFNPLAPTDVFNVIVDDVRPESNMVPGKSYLYDSVMLNYDQMNCVKQSENIQHKIKIEEAEALMVTLFGSQPGAHRYTSAIDSTPMMIMVVFSEYADLCTHKAVMRCVTDTTGDIGDIACHQVYDLTQKRIPQWEPLELVIFSSEPVPKSLNARVFNNTRAFAKYVAAKLVELDSCVS